MGKVGSVGGIEGIIKNAARCRRIDNPKPFQKVVSSILAPYAACENPSIL